MRPAVLTVNDRIRTSELFPRIRDAEKEMKEKEKELLEKIEKAKKLKKKKLEAFKNRHKEEIIITKPWAPKEVLSPESAKQYFTSFVLDKDPQSSKYMPFDKVYFPKLFDKDTAAMSAQSIDRLWLLGFQDLAINESNKKANPQHPL